MHSAPAYNNIITVWIMRHDHDGQENQVLANRGRIRATMLTHCLRERRIACLFSKVRQEGCFGLEPAHTQCQCWRAL